MPKKVIVRFLSEWMNAIDLMKSLLANYWDSGKKFQAGISRFLKKRNYSINSLEFSIMKILEPKLFERYSFSFYYRQKHSIHIYTHDKLMDSMQRFSQIVRLDENIDHLNFREFLGNAKWVDVSIKLIKNRFDLRDALLNLVSYKLDFKKIPSKILLYVNALILIQLSDSYSTLDKRFHMIQLEFGCPDGYVNKWVWPGLNQTVTCFNSNIMSPKNIAAINGLYSTNKFVQWLVITKNKRKYRHEVRLLSRIHEISTGWIMRVKNPYDNIEYNLSGNVMIFVFPGCENYFSRISCNRFFAILYRESKTKLKKMF